MADIPGSVVAQVIIEPIECFWNVLIALAIHDVQPFARVSMEKPQPVVLQADGRPIGRHSYAQKNDRERNGLKQLSALTKEEVFLRMQT
jgi:hypothetical protein